MSVWSIQQIRLYEYGILLSILCKSHVNYILISLSIRYFFNHQTMSLDVSPNPDYSSENKIWFILPIRTTDNEIINRESRGSQIPTIWYLTKIILNRKRRNSFTWTRKYWRMIIYCCKITKVTKARAKEIWRIRLS